jgi:Domain of unknown function (DUF4390)
MARLLRARLLVVSLFVLFTQPTLATDERIDIRNVFIDTQTAVLQLNARLSLVLPMGARAAIHDGSAMTFDLQFELRRGRSFWRDEVVAALTQHYVLNYHALSERYILRNLNSGEQTTFSSLDTALQQLSTLSALPILDRDLLEVGKTYQARLRAEIDVHTLPDSIRWMLFWTDNWKQTSEWHLWPLKL